MSAVAASVEFNSDKSAVSGAETHRQLEATVPGCGQAEGGDVHDMDAVAVPAGADALEILESVMGSLAGTDPADLEQRRRST